MPGEVASLTDVPSFRGPRVRHGRRRRSISLGPILPTSACLTVQCPYPRTAFSGPRTAPEMPLPREKCPNPAAEMPLPRPRAAPWARSPWLDREANRLSKCIPHWVFAGDSRDPDLCPVPWPRVDPRRHAQMACPFTLPTRRRFRRTESADLSGQSLRRLAVLDHLRGQAVSEKALAGAGSGS